MRLWEIDFARGIAVIVMVLFNWSFALYYLGVYTITDSWGFWQILPRLIGGSFIFIAGMSLWLSYSNNVSVKRHLSRGLKIFAIGLGITAATWLVFPRDVIVFGILHMIGLSVITGYFLIRIEARMLAGAAVSLIAAGIILQNYVFGFPYLVWLGFIPAGFRTLDYFPMLPWLGVFLAGIAFGKVFYTKNAAKTKQNLSPITFAGRHSLAIYLAHQPLLIAALFAMGLL